MDSYLIPPPTREELQREFDFVDDLVSYWHERYETSLARRTDNLRRRWAIGNAHWRNGWWLNGAKRFADEATSWEKSYETAMNEAEKWLDYYTDWMIQVRAWLVNYNLIVKSWPTILAQLSL